MEYMYISVQNTKLKHVESELKWGLERKINKNKKVCTVHLGTRVLSLDFFVIIIVSTEFMVLLDGKVESEKNVHIFSTIE